MKIRLSLILIKNKKVLQKTKHKCINQFWFIHHESEFNVIGVTMGVYGYYLLAFDYL